MLSSSRGCFESRKQPSVKDHAAKKNQEMLKSSVLNSPPNFWQNKELQKCVLDTVHPSYEHFTTTSLVRQPECFGLCQKKVFGTQLRYTPFHLLDLL